MGATTAGLDPKRDPPDVTVAGVGAPKIEVGADEVTIPAEPNIEDEAGGFETVDVTTAVPKGDVAPKADESPNVDIGAVEVGCGNVVVVEVVETNVPPPNRLDAGGVTVVDVVVPNKFLLTEFPPKTKLVEPASPTNTKNHNHSQKKNPKNNNLTITRRGGSCRYCC